MRGWHGSRGTCAVRAPSLRQGKPWKGGSDVDKTETFRSGPEGSTPSRQRLASQPEVSLAWAEATLFVKRRQRVLKLCIWPRNHVTAGAFVLLGAGAASRRPLWRGLLDPAGVLEHGRGMGWTAKEPEKSCSVRVRKAGMGDAGIEMPLA